MGESRRKALTSYRRRMRRKGMLRMELPVRTEDADLIREVVKTLADPEHEAEARAYLRERFGVRRQVGLKVLLAAAPLDVDLDRRRDADREVEL